MLMTYESPNTFFIEKDDARKFLDNIPVDGTYWTTYSVRLHNSGRYVIDIIDENGDHVGYF